MSVDYNLIAVAIGLITAITAVVGLWLEGRRTRIVSQATLSVSLEERFNGPEMRGVRRVAAQRLKEERAESIIVEFNEVLDFFALVAVLLEGRAIGFALTHSLYSYWLTRYWRAGQRYIEWERKACEDPEAWQSVQRLVTKIERQMAKHSVPLPSKDELLRFLDEEACC
jgi:hypothetical protein